ncbi:MAG: dockerin type I repeat-containing protein [Oscillospiraceae bacterium]|nr:dockerin type I repeat-containing protein [Oscillospiraceae bacterium]
MKRKIKNIFVFVLAAVLCMQCAVFSSAAEQTYKIGDVDFDGKLTASDARWILRASVGLEKYSKDSLVFSAADTDKDGKLTAADARWTLRAAVGLEALAPTPETSETALLKDYLNNLTKKYGSSIEFKYAFKQMYLSNETGMSGQLPYSAVSRYSEGIISAYITDFNGDSIPEMITARLEKATYSWKIILSHYIVKNGKVSLESDFYKGEEFENFNDYIKVYLTEKGDNKYINIVDNFGALSTSTNQSISLYSFGVNKNNKTEQLHCFTSFTGSWGRYGYILDEETVAGEYGDNTSFDSILNKAKTALSACGINGFSENTAFDFPSSCQKVLYCGTSIEDETIFIDDFSGYLSGLQTHELSQSDAYDLLKKSQEVYGLWIFGSWIGKYTDENFTSITKNGDRYYLVTHPAYTSVAALKKGLSNYFTPNIYEDHVNSSYIDYNGRLYGLDFAYGDIGPEKIAVSILSQTEDYCVIQIIGTNTEYDYTSTDLMSMKKINGKWVFDYTYFMFYFF